MKAKVIKTGEIVDVHHEPQHGQVSNIYKESVLVNGRMWSEEELDFFVKANKAPEKIYIPINNTIEPRFLEDYWVEFPVSGQEAEYTRTDAFIEKACEKLKKCMYDNLMFQGRLHRKEVIETFVEKFKKYMEE